jgi:hypothetical protein
VSAAEHDNQAPAVPVVTADEGEPAGAGALAVCAVLVPVLSGTFAVIALLVGYVLEAIAPKEMFGKTMLTAGWVSGAMTAAAILIVAVGLLVAALRNRPQEEESEASGRTVRPLGRTARRTLGVASFVVGERRAHLREEWVAVLVGDPESGIVLSSRRRTYYVIGFLWAALRMRLRDLGAPLWTPVDWLLSTDSRVQGFIALTVGAQVVYVQYQDGFHALVTEGWGWCAGCGVALRLLIGWLRKIRGIELASTRSDSSGR